MPNVFGPPAADIHLRDRLADERIDQRRLAGADLAEDDNLDAARFELVGHFVQLVEVALERSPFFGAATDEAANRLPHRGKRSIVIGIARNAGARSDASLRLGPPIFN